MKTILMDKEQLVKKVEELEKQLIGNFNDGYDDGWDDGVKAVFGYINFLVTTEMLTKEIFDKFRKKDGEFIEKLRKEFIFDEKEKEVKNEKNT